KPPGVLRARIQRWASSWSVWQRRNSSRVRSPRFTKARCRPPRSTGYQRYSRHSSAKHVDRRDRPRSIARSTPLASILATWRDAAERGHLSFKLVSRAKLVPFPVSLRLVFAHWGGWANDRCAPSIYGIWHHL